MAGQRTIQHADRPGRRPRQAARPQDRRAAVGRVLRRPGRGRTCSRSPSARRARRCASTRWTRAASTAAAPAVTSSTCRHTRPSTRRATRSQLRREHRHAEQPLGGHRGLHDSQREQLHEGARRDCRRHEQLLRAGLRADEHAPSTGSSARSSCRVKRPGFHVRARKGYLATPDLAAAAPPPAATPAPAAPEPAPPAEPTPAQTSAAVEGALTEALASASGAAPDIWSVLLPPPGAAGATGALCARHPLDRASGRGGRAAARDAGPPAARRAGRRSPHGAGKPTSAATSRRQRRRLRPVAAEATAPPWVWYVLGWSHYALGEYAPAIAVWQRVLDADPAFEPVYFDLADAYLQQKAYDTALELLGTAGVRWPADAESFDAQGVIQTRAGALDDCGEELRDSAGRRAGKRHVALQPGARLRAAVPAPDARARGTPQNRRLRRYGPYARRRRSTGGLSRRADRWPMPAATACVAWSRSTSRRSTSRPPPRSPPSTASGWAAIPTGSRGRPTATRLYVRGIETDRQGRITTRDARPGSACRAAHGNARPEAPVWAADYWTWKSAKTAPWIPTLRDRIEHQPRGRLAQQPVPARPLQRHRQEPAAPEGRGDRRGGRRPGDPRVTPSAGRRTPWASSHSSTASAT